MDTPDRISINWQSKCVRVWEGRRNGQQTYFSAKDYGSIEQALAAAIEYEKTLSPDARFGRHHARTKANSNSKTDIVGVSPIKNPRTGEEFGYRANWIQEIDGKRKPRGKDFYTSVYDRITLEMAVQWRDAMVKKHMTPK